MKQRVVILSEKKTLLTYYISYKGGRLYLPEPPRPLIFFIHGNKIVGVYVVVGNQVVGENVGQGAMVVVGPNVGQGAMVVVGPNVGHGCIVGRGDVEGTGETVGTVGALNAIPCSHG